MAGTVLRGVTGSPGVALGPAFIVREASLEESSPVAAERDGIVQPAGARERWLAARQRVDQTYQWLAGRAKEVAGPEEAAILEAQAMMIMDPDLEEQVGTRIDQGTTVEAATRAAIAQYADALGSLDDAYMRQRADDVREVGQALLRALAGADPVPLAALPSGSVLCAESLAAGSLIMLDRERLAGLALGTGGPTSHIAILARTLNVPAVLGLGAFVDALTDGTPVGVDGTRGEVYVDPSGEQLENLQKAIAAYTEERTELASLVDLPATTPDGVHVELFANIGGPADVEPALASGAEGIGLFRTEFLITGRATLPSEEEQYRTYRAVLSAAGSRTVIFRTFDIGGDKPVPALALPAEANPFLGYRALRIGLDRTELLTTQFRAILRAAEGDHSAWIMLPMVATVDEVRRARALYEEARRGFNTSAPLGIMIEIPAAALNAEALARHVDFFSIGTNDLVQYTLAVDRLDERLAGLYQPFHPAVLKLIRMTAEAARAAGKPCGVCGEMGGDAEATALLLGLGVTELSMSAGSLGSVKREVRRTPLADARRLAAAALACATSEEVRAVTREFRATYTSTG